jgi:hypothetical protein
MGGRLGGLDDFRKLDDPYIVLERAPDDFLSYIYMYDLKELQDLCAIMKYLPVPVQIEHIPNLGQNQVKTLKTIVKIPCCSFT